MVEEDKMAIFSKRDFLYILFKHKWTISFLTVSAIIVIFLGVQLLPEAYEARASILVKMGRENVSFPTISPYTQQQVMAAIGVRKEDINSEIAIFENRMIIERVIRKLGVEYLFPEEYRPTGFFKKIKYDIKNIFKKIKISVNNVLYKMELKNKLSLYELAVMTFQKQLRVQQMTSADVIELSFKWFSPEIAKVVLDSMIELYLEHHLEAHSSLGGLEFFRTQVQIIRDKLIESENKLKLLMENQDITSYDEQSQLLLLQLNNFGASLKLTQTDFVESNTKIKSLEYQMAAILKSITPGFDLAYKEAEKELLMEKVHLDTLKSKERELVKHIESYEKELQTLNNFNHELKSLTRQIEINEENYMIYRKKLEENRISDVLDKERIVNVKVISPAASSFLPIMPRKLLILVIGLLFSIIFSIGFAFLLEYLDHSLNDADDVKKHLSLSILAVIREVKR